MRVPLTSTVMLFVPLVLFFLIRIGDLQTRSVFLGDEVEHLKPIATHSQLQTGHPTVESGVGRRGENVPFHRCGNYIETETIFSTGSIRYCYKEEKFSTLDLKDKVIVGVVSEPENVARRDVIRATWGKGHFVIFLVFVTPTQNDALLDEISEVDDMILIKSKQSEMFALRALFNLVQRSSFGYILKTVDDGYVDIEAASLSLHEKKPDYWGHCNPVWFKNETLIFAQKIGYALSYSFVKCLSAELSTNDKLARVEAGAVTVGEGAVLCDVGCTTDGAITTWKRSHAYNSSIAFTTKVLPGTSASKAEEVSLNGVIRPAEFLLTTMDSYHSPYVIEKHRLLFFPIPKISSTTFIMLLRRMQGFENWNKLGGGMVHTRNGVKRLYEYPKDVAEEMLNSANWTRAVFLRDPKKRMLSAYLDKKDTIIPEACCPREEGPEKSACIEEISEEISTFKGWVELVQKSKGMCNHNPHWAPQSSWIDERLLPHINFIGRFDALKDDTEKLLRSLKPGNAWEAYGATGWGVNGDEAIYQGYMIHHTTNASDKVAMHFDEELTRNVEKHYSEDYRIFDFEAAP